MDRFSDEAGQSQHLSEALLSFAQHRQLKPDRIAGLRQESEVFREICADYEECCAQLLKLEKNSMASGQFRDYSEMRDQLERELQWHLENTGRTCGGGNTVETVESE